MKQIILALAAVAIVSACTARPPKVSVIKPAAQTSSVAILQRINASAFSCWRKDKAFKAYGIIPELDTTGTPRILIVPKGKPQSLPKLVITATGRSVQTFGPLATSPLASRIQSDVSRWATGNTDCNASA